MFVFQNNFWTFGPYAVFCFAIVFLTVTPTRPTRTSERYCSETRTENRTETITTQIPCNQTYTARCGWFSLSYCTFHRIAFCPHQENRTKTYHITDIKCCTGFKLTRRKTCIPLDAEEEEEPEEEYIVTTSAAPQKKKKDDVLIVSTSHPHFPDNSGVEPDTPVDVYNRTNGTNSYNTVDKTKTDFSKNQQSSSGKDKKKLTVGAFAGIVCGGVFIGSIVGLAAIRIRKRQRRKKLKAERAASSIEIQHLQSNRCSEA